MVGTYSDYPISLEYNRFCFYGLRKTRWLFFLGCIGAFLMGLSFIIGVHFDIKTLVYLYFFANLINSLPAFILLKNILKFSYIELVNVFFRTISPAFLMFLLIKVWQHFSFFKMPALIFLLMSHWVFLVILFFIPCLISMRLLGQE